MLIQGTFKAPFLCSELFPSLQPPECGGKPEFSALFSDTIQSHAATRPLFRSIEVKPEKSTRSRSKQRFLLVFLSFLLSTIRQSLLLSDEPGLTIHSTKWFLVLSDVLVINKIHTAIWFKNRQGMLFYKLCIKTESIEGTGSETKNRLWISPKFKGFWSDELTLLNEQKSASKPLKTDFGYLPKLLDSLNRSVVVSNLRISFNKRQKLTVKLDFLFSRLNLLVKKCNWIIFVYFATNISYFILYLVKRSSLRSKWGRKVCIVLGNFYWSIFFIS